MNAEGVADQYSIEAAVRGTSPETQGFKDIGGPRVLGSHTRVRRVQGIVVFGLVASEAAGTLA